MVHEDIYLNDGFRQTDFISSLAYVPLKKVQTSGINGLPEVGLFSETGVDGANQADINTVFAGYLNSFSSTDLPQTWDAFVNGWRNYYTLAAPTNQNLPPNTKLAAYYQAVNIGPQGGPFFNGMVNQFSTALMNVSYDNINLLSNSLSDTRSDWQILQSATPPTTPPIDSNTMSANFVAAFNHFLQNYSFTTINGVKSVLPSTTDPSYFFNQWYQFTGVTATLQIAQTPLISANSGQYTQGLPSYEAIYYAFHPGATKAQFQQDLVTFYNEQMKANGYFLPSQMLDTWYTVNKTVYDKSINATASFSTASAEKALILNRLINLLISMISILQKVGVAQANQLKFVTNFQNIYVQLQTQIPVLSRGDVFGPGSGATGTTPLGLKTTAANDERNAINTSFNAAKTEMMRAFRGIQEDIAKQIQSRVNQTNDTVNQQTDMATAILQQLSGLVGAIFR